MYVLSYGEALSAALGSEQSRDFPRERVLWESLLSIIFRSRLFGRQRLIRATITQSHWLVAPQNFCTGWQRRQTANLPNLASSLHLGLQVRAISWDEPLP